TGNGDYIRDALAYHRMDWRAAARVFEYGKQKYAAWNWAKGMAWSVPLACAARHALAILEGDETDPESGLPHVGHYIANLVMLAHFVRWYPEGNDLPPPELFRDAPVSRHSPEGFDEVLAAAAAEEFVDGVMGSCDQCSSGACECAVP